MPVSFKLNQSGASCYGTIPVIWLIVAYSFDVFLCVFQTTLRCTIIYLFWISFEMCFFKEPDWTVWKMCAAERNHTHQKFIPDERTSWL